MRVLAVTNMYPSVSNPALGTFVEQQVKGLESCGVDVNVLFVDRVREGVGAYLRVPGLVRSRLRSFNPNVVHVMYGGVMADVVTRVVRDRPTVVTFHGADLLGVHLAGFFRGLLGRSGVYFSQKAAQRAAGIVVVAKILEGALPADVDRGKVRVIPCGIDLTRFKPLNKLACVQKLAWRTDCFRVLFNSNGDDPVKRPGLARAAVEALNRSGVRAVLYELHGVPNGDVPVWLNASDVVLLTSISEASPTIVKEALACNVPVVSVDVGDVRERIAGINGCYLASPEPEDLARKLMMVYSGPRHIEGREELNELSIDRIALRLSALYEEVSGCQKLVPSPEQTTPSVRSARLRRGTASSHGGLSKLKCP